MGLFEANAIQFGLDQLQRLLHQNYIHWYYWTHNVVQLVAMYLIIGNWKIIEASIFAPMISSTALFRILY